MMCYLDIYFPVMQSGSHLVIQNGRHVNKANKIDTLIQLKALAKKLMLLLGNQDNQTNVNFTAIQ